MQVELSTFLFWPSKLVEGQFSITITIISKNKGHNDQSLLGKDTCPH